MGRISKVAGRRLIRVAFRVGLRDAIRSLRQRGPLHRLLEGPVVAEPGCHRVGCRFLLQCDTFQNVLPLEWQERQPELLAAVGALVLRVLARRQVRGRGLRPRQVRRRGEVGEDGGEVAAR